MGPVTTDREIRGDGTSPAVWASWLRRAALPELPPLPVERRLVVVAPHPDDELLACAALLRHHAAQGGQVQVVAVTDGEASHGGRDRIELARLALRRCRESIAGLNRLGLPASHRSIRLRLPDGGLATRGPLLQEALASIVREGDLVVSTWRLDGHPDHDAVGAAAAHASANHGCHHLEAPVWTWHWATPGDVRIPWKRVRRFPVDGAAAAAKQAALAQHGSQLEDRPGGAAPVLGAHILARAAWPDEYFLV